MKKKIIIEKSELPITSKSGLYLLDFLLDQMDCNRKVNRIFGALGDWLYRQCQIPHANKKGEKKKMKSVPSSGLGEREQQSASEVGSFFTAVFTVSSGLCGLACA